ncbi:MAG: Uma2 family endonuclease [Myxococcales bacterium]|nr:Uma2 family endonuclease [Myxococcales bacterium]
MREYWLIDPRPERVSVFNLSGTRYGKPRVAEGRQVASSRVVPGLELRPADLFD